MALHDYGKCYYHRKSYFKSKKKKKSDHFLVLAY